MHLSPFTGKPCRTNGRNNINFYLFFYACAWVHITHKSHIQIYKKVNERVRTKANRKGRDDEMEENVQFLSLYSPYILTNCLSSDLSPTYNLQTDCKSVHTDIYCITSHMLWQKTTTATSLVWTTHKRWMFWYDSIRCGIHFSLATILFSFIPLFFAHSFLAFFYSISRNNWRV